MTATFGTLRRRSNQGGSEAGSDGFGWVKRCSWVVCIVFLSWAMAGGGAGRVSERRTGEANDERSTTLYPSEGA